MLAELDGNGDGMITLTSFSEWMMRTYTSFLRDPSLVRDSYDALRNVSPDEIVLMTPQGDGDPETPRARATA